MKWVNKQTQSKLKLLHRWENCVQPNQATHTSWCWQPVFTLQGREKKTNKKNIASQWRVLHHEQFFPLCLPWKQAVARGALIKNILLHLSTLSVLGFSPLSCQSSRWNSFPLNTFNNLSFLLIEALIRALHCPLLPPPSSPNNIDPHIICLWLVLVRCA